MANKLLVCNLCNGEMQLYTGPRYSRKLGVFLVGVGIFLTLFWMGPVLGVPLFFIGLYMVGAKRQLWVCKECNTGIERIELKPEQTETVKKTKE
ncbi:MAG: hypothetical protein HQL23_02585 [Candidatus Omnitrophica bacterium]|nr:hypothetical protein [Candidatus Omnitrophota bacterium]